MGEIDDVKNNILKGLRDRLSSPFYGYFLISWFIWNWKIIYITLFLSNESIYQSLKILKIDYVSNLIREASFLGLILYPFLSVVFLVWLAPFFTRLVYSKVKDDEWKLKETDELIKQKYVDLKEATLKKEIKLNTTEKQLFIKEPKILYRKEFDEFKKSKYYQKFQQIIDSRYSNEGFVNEFDRYNNVIRRIIDSDMLAYADAQGLLHIRTLSDKAGGQIELTDKGKFFVGSYKS